MLSTSQCADVLGVSASRVRKLIADGALGATKVGNAWLIPEEEAARRLLERPKAGRPKRKAPRAVPAAAEGAQGGDGFLGELPPDDLRKRDLYRECKEAFRLRPGPKLMEVSETPEEAAFYMAVADFFLQQRQRELVAAGVY